MMVNLLHIIAFRHIGLLDRPDERGGVVIEYGVLIATIVLLLTTVGSSLVPAVAGWFTALGGRIAAL